MTASPAIERGAWRRFTDAYAKLLSHLLSLSVLVLVFPVTLQIFSRFTDLLPHYIWTEEMARLLFVWMVMIGAMLGVRESAHFIVDVWPRMSPRPSAALNLVASLAVLVLAVVFLWFGIEFTQFGWNRISELAELPLWMIHIAWPIAGLTWIVFLGEQMVDQWRVLVGGAR
ncbi:MAG: TRAP transporter small permease [Burkholderiaceae bacterium]|nr:TRAP transporter small permease [Burkholderiaceae bacterium]